jgi:hypothetical protein
MTSAVGVKLMVLGERLLMTVESTASISGSIGLAWTMAGIAMPAMVSMSILDEVSMLVGAAMPTMVSMSILGVVSMLVGAAMPTMVPMSILEVVGDRAGESIDPDPVVPTVGAN